MFSIKLIFLIFLDKQVKTVRAFKSNYPGPDFVKNFIKNSLTTRVATNNKSSRFSVDRTNIIEFFDKIKAALGDIDNKNLYLQLG